jgi:hypothetical protein
VSKRCRATLPKLRYVRNKQVEEDSDRVWEKALIFVKQPSVVSV